MRWNQSLVGKMGVTVILKHYFSDFSSLSSKVFIYIYNQYDINVSNWKVKCQL